MASLDHADEQDFRAWLRLVKEAVLDLLRAAEDQTREPSQRDLGRRAAAAIVAESGHALEELLALAERSAGHADPSGFGGSNDVN